MSSCIGHRYITVGLGVRVDIPTGYVGLLTLRSSAAKRGLESATKPGIIDSDYRGELKMVLRSVAPLGAEIVQMGECIAQLLIVPLCPFPAIPMEISEDATTRGAGGFGSTG